MEDKFGIYFILVFLMFFDVCWGMLCGFGVVCEFNVEGLGWVFCVCKKGLCFSVVVLVCGLDVFIYSNECEL